MITIGPAAASTVWILRIFGLVMIGLSWFVVYQLYVTNDSWKDNIPLSDFLCSRLFIRAAFSDETRGHITRPVV